MDDRPKTIQLKAERENAQLWLRKSWPGHTVVATEGPTTPMRITSSLKIAVPLCDPLGPVSRERELRALRTVYQGPTDIYIVCCTTPSGKQKHGMVAVPKTLVPVFELV